MKCEEVKINLPEYIDGKLAAEITKAVESHLEGCEDCRGYYSEMKTFLGFMETMPRVEPPAGMEEEFRRMADAEFGDTKTKVVRFPGWLKVAAMLIFVAGSFAVGYKSGAGKGDSKLLQAEVGQLKQKVLLTSLREMSGPEKIDAVYSIKASGQADENVVDALIHTMNSDRNVNVRMAAILALSEMIKSNPKITNELIHSLTLQENPLLQISLIQVLSNAGVKEAKSEIEKLSEDDGADQNVRAYAKDMVKTII
jgi:hypothetical protein